MTTTPARPLLRMLPDGQRGPHGSRSAATCHYRCGHACDQPEPNRTGHEHVSTVIETALQRRTLLRGAAVGAGALVVGAGSTLPAAAAPARSSLAPLAAGSDTFDPVDPNVRDALTVPRGYVSNIVASWGDPILPGAPAFDPLAQTPESAAAQFGYNCDYVGVLPLDRRSALLVVNHEYTNEELMFPAGVYDAATIKRVAIASHGMSVVRIQRAGSDGGWEMSPNRWSHNRRITGNTPFAFDGPAVGDPRLRTTMDPLGRRPLGTLNNCAGGQTPWGTVLSGEENFNQYFSASGTVDARYTASYARYGISATGSSRQWREVDPRFDLTTEPHEPFRFGWIVEVDPYDKRHTPRKHTMLGRFKHEGANIVIAEDGRAVAYLGDDERGDYLYRFVSAERYDPRRGVMARRHNLRLLSKGTLYVARLTGDGSDDGTFDGTGEWIPLTSDTESLVPGMSVADVLVDTRLAADLVAPTRMDRPEDVEPNLVNGKVYAALTNNSNRGTTFPVDEANPLASSQVRAGFGAPLTTVTGNRNGYVLEMTPDGGDHTGTGFTWLLLLVCGDPEAPETYFAGYPKDQVSPISCPDNVAFDSRGNLWVATDGNVLGSNDGLFRVPVAGPDRGRVQQFLTVPLGAECCGPLIADRDRSVWVAVQHPGEGTGSTFDTPLGTWPHSDPFPRPSVVVTWKA